MGLRTFVKINSVTNLSDARYCAAMSVDQIGFCIDPSSKNYVASTIIEEITGWISGVEIISELEDVNGIAITDIIEINSLQRISAIGKKVIIHIPLTEAENNIDLISTTSNLDYVIINGEEELNDNTLLRIKKLANQLPVVLGFGINAKNVIAIIETTNIKGIALTGSNEIRPGFKDYDELADILEAIEED